MSDFCLDIREAVYRPQVKEYLDKRGILDPVDFYRLYWDVTRWGMEASTYMY